MVAAERVLGVAEARAQLSTLLSGFREDPHAGPVAIGAHRRPVAYLVPVDSDLQVVSRPLLPELRRLARVIERLAQASGLADVRVFGSVAREEDRGDSDLDLLVTPSEGATYFDFARFAQDMESLTGRTVDVMSDRSLRAGADDVILREAVAL